MVSFNELVFIEGQMNSVLLCLVFIKYQKKNLQKLTDVETLGSSNEKGLIPQILKASGVLNQTKPQESPYPAQLHIRLIQPLILTF